MIKNINVEKKVIFDIMNNSSDVITVDNLSSVLCNWSFDRDFIAITKINLEIILKNLSIHLVVESDEYAVFLYRSWPCEDVCAAILLSSNDTIVLDSRYPGEVAYYSTAILPAGDDQGQVFLVSDTIPSALAATYAAQGGCGVVPFSNDGLSVLAATIRQRHAHSIIMILAAMDGDKPQSAFVDAARVSSSELCKPIVDNVAWPDFFQLACYNDRLLSPIFRRAYESTLPALIKHDEIRRQTGLVLRCAASIAPEPVHWLWDGWLAAGKLGILAGSPGTSKTTLTLAMMATLSVGGQWPDGSFAEIAESLIWSGEDDAGDTLVPRLIAAGADLGRIHLIHGMCRDQQEREFNPSNDLPYLEMALKQLPEVRLIVIDSIVSAIAGDSHKNAEVRRGLQPLVDLAKKYRCAVLGITHLSKGTQGKDTVERITGSIAFAALARLVLVVARSQKDDSDELVLIRAKSNIGPDRGGFRYQLVSDVVPTEQGDIPVRTVQFGDYVDGRANELLECLECPPAIESELEKAKDFLQALLEGEPVATTEIKLLATEADLTWSTVRNAQKVLGIKPVKRGFGKNSYWAWMLPDATDLNRVGEQTSFPDCFEYETGDSSNGLDAKMLITMR